MRGAISGFFTGLFVAIDLMFFGSIQTDSALVTILPVAGLVVGLLLGLWAPFGRAPAPASTAAPVGAPPQVSPLMDAPGQPAPPPPPPGVPADAPHPPEPPADEGAGDTSQ